MEYDVFDQLRTQNIVERELKKEVFETAAQKKLFAECMDSKYLPYLREAGKEDTKVCQSLGEKFASEVYLKKEVPQRQEAKGVEKSTAEKAYEYAEGLRSKLRTKLGIADR